MEQLNISIEMFIPKEILLYDVIQNKTRFKIYNK